MSGLKAGLHCGLGCLEWDSEKTVYRRALGQWEAPRLWRQANPSLKSQLWPLAVRDTRSFELLNASWSEGFLIYETGVEAYLTDC